MEKAKIVFTERNNGSNSGLKLPLKSFNKTILKERQRVDCLLKKFQRLTPAFVAIFVGIVVGFLAIQSKQSSAKWTFVIIVATVAPSIVLLTNDIKKLIFIAIIVDLVLGIDIAVQNQGWHRGGPTGYMVSLTTIALIVGYTLWIIEKKPRPHFFWPVTAPALLYIMMSVVSFSLASNLQLSTFGFFLKVQAFLMYFYLINHVKTWADIRLIVTTAVICLLFESALMVLQYFTGMTLNIGGLVTSGAVTEASGGTGVTGSRVSGTLGVSANAALYLNSMLTLTLGAYLTGKLVDKRLALTAFALGIIALIGTSSRAGWAAFAVAILILLGQAVRMEAGRKAIPIFLVGGLLASIFFGEQIQKRFVTVTEDKSREQLAFMAHNIIRAYPLGVGDNNYDQVMSDKYAHPAWVGHKHRPPHNKYLVIWANMGLQGLVFFVLFLIAAIWPARRWLFQNNAPPHLVILAVGLLSGLTTHLIHMRSETFNGRSQTQLLWFIIAMLVIINQFITQSKPVCNSETNQKNGKFFLPNKLEPYEDEIK